ncbi:hypothetical protein [Proteus penneri]|uniref:hypothetical protein n=1 Tax=Proteus penneri TaxID=102862 RepID=UPI0034D57F9E
MDNKSIEAKIASLTNIQGIINRFSDVSSKLKGIYITVMSALLTVAITYLLPKQDADMPLMYLLLMALIFFVIFLCFLSVDSTYLYYERIMRKVYDAKANDKCHDGSEIKNYFEITNEFNLIKNNKVVSRKLSLTQLFFYGVPFLIFELSIFSIWMK